MAGLLEIIGPPPFEASPYGLLSVRGPDAPENDRWLNGFTYEARSCTARVNLLDVCNGNPPVNVIAPPPGLERNRDYVPFVIEAVDTCSTFGFKQRDAEQRAIEALEACTQKALEAEFWNGNLATTNGYTSNRFLASADSTDVTPGGGPIKIRYGLALLEQALADCGCGTRGTIHVTTAVGSALAVKKVDDHLETQLGNFVIVGAGYDGSGPDGAVPATGTWMYATGPVSVLLGESEAVGANIAEQVDRSDNTWEARAQRGAAVTWDGCCAFAVHVDLALDYS